MDITKEDSKMLKGVAILAMLMLHLFCRTANLPYTPLLWIGNIPFVYYLGLFGDICVSIFCFISGYAHFMQNTASPANRWKHLLRFMIVFWIIVVLSSVVGLLTGNRAIPGNGKEFLLNCLTLRNSYNGAWWYANTYILLNVLQPFSRRFAERCPVWVVLSAAFVFYTVGYGIRFWGWGACDHAVLQWIITHIGLLGTSYFPYMIGMVFCRKQPISALRNWISLHNVPYIYDNDNDIHCDDRPAWDRTIPVCCRSYCDSYHCAALYLSHAALVAERAAILRCAFYEYLADTYVLLYRTP